MERIQILREILFEGRASTQDELRDELKRRNWSVTQSTISRDLKRIGAIKTLDSAGRTVYRLGEEFSGPGPVPTPVVNSIGDLIEKVTSNGAMIVVRTSPGSASLVARQNNPAFPIKLRDALHVTLATVN